MFNSSRLTLARQRRSLTKKELAESIGLSRRMVSKYESGDGEPSPATIQLLIRELGFPASFFEAETIEPPPVDGVSFRSLSSMRASQRDAVRSQATIAQGIADWIDVRFRLPEPNIPDIRYDESPEAAAESVRAEWGLGQRSIRNLVHLLEAHGARVFSLAESSREVDAFSFWRDGTPFIFLNTTKSGERGRTDAAHELGHLVMHRHGPPRGRDAEREANIFASAFLMPRSSVIASKPRSINLSTLDSLKSKWGVSAVALNYRLHALGLTSDWHYRSLCIELSKRGYRTTEPNGIEREASQLLQKVFHDLRLDGVTLDDVAGELHISPEELRGLVFGLVRELRHLPGENVSGEMGPGPPTRPHLRPVK